MAEDVAGDLPITSRVVIPGGELAWRFSRSSGPGGQSVNTSDSRVELSWDPTTSAALTTEQRARLIARLRHRLVDDAIVVRASEHRSQWQNRRAARIRLADLVRFGLRPPPKQRRRTRPKRSAVEDRLASKRRRARIKKDRGRPGSDD